MSSQSSRCERDGHAGGAFSKGSLSLVWSFVALCFLLLPCCNGDEVLDPPDVGADPGGGVDIGEDEGTLPVDEGAPFIRPGLLRDHAASLSHGGCARLPRSIIFGSKPSEEDDSTDEAFDDGSSPTEEAGAPEGIYPSLAVHSPLSKRVLEKLAAIAALDPGMNDDVFMKVGDSHSVSVTFLGCYIRPDLDLGEHGHLRATLDYFTNEKAAGTSSFERQSIAAVSGIGAAGITRGEPSILRQEIDALQPRFAVVMLGTNDVGYRSLRLYVDDMLRIVDELTASGVIPLLSSIPPLADVAENKVANGFNAMLRAIASSRSLLFVDLYQSLLPLPDMGLRSDGVHLSVDWNRGGGMAACRMVDGGLGFGANVRNLLTLEQLERAQRGLLEPETFVSEDFGRLGTGTEVDPLRIDGLPFGDGGSIDDGKLRPASAIPEPCAGTTPSAGFVYSLRVSKTTALRAVLHVEEGQEASLELSSADGYECISSGDAHLEAMLEPGSYRVVLRLDDAGGHSAEYLLGLYAH